MLSARELSKHLEKYLIDIKEISTKELKELLKKDGIFYKRDYDIMTFSNAVATLKRKRYISNRGKQQGHYSVISSQTMNDDNKKNSYIYESISTNKELEDIKNKISLHVNEECRYIEELLDSLKPSVFCGHIQTYKEIMELLRYLKTFRFS